MVWLDLSPVAKKVVWAKSCSGFILPPCHRYSGCSDATYCLVLGFSPCASIFAAALNRGARASSRRIFVPVLRLSATFSHASRGTEPIIVYICIHTCKCVCVYVSIHVYMDVYVFPVDIAKTKPPSIMDSISDEWSGQT